MDPGAPSRTAEYMALFRALESVRPAERRLFDDRSAVDFLRPRLRVVARAARRAPVRSMVVALIDHPSTQAHKRAVLATVPANVRYVPVDFEHDSLTTALADAEFNRRERTCVLWEGVFSYLTPQAIDETLNQLVELCPTGSQIVLTYVDRRALETPPSVAPAWLAAVQAVGEPFRTGLHPARAQAFFAARGLSLRNDESTTEAASRLGVARAQTIPSLYRVATLDVGDGSAVDLANGDARQAEKITSRS
jgi:O-methyltransferase involved in polyketide biosynthesis